jgi:hypothetical protein
MSAGEVHELSRSLGRIEETLRRQDEMMIELRAEVQVLRSEVADLRGRPARTWNTIGKYIASIAATIAAGLALLFLRKK